MSVRLFGLMAAMTVVVTSGSAGLAADPAAGRLILIQGASEAECSGVPPQALPPNGDIDDSSDEPLVAPFRIITSGSTHYYVKLFEVGTNEEVLAVFVRAGQTADIKVPLGSYEVRYAAGSTWYGDECHFGADTSYAKADTVFDFRREGNSITGYSITLYAVPGGNLSTSRIGRGNF